MTGLYLTGNYSNLTNWAFPSGAAINPGQYLVIFADGETNLSTLSQLHASFVPGGSNGSVALSRVFNGQPQVLDYVNYTNLPANWSYGSLPNGQKLCPRGILFSHSRRHRQHHASAVLVYRLTTDGASTARTLIACNCKRASV